MTHKVMRKEKWTVVKEENVAKEENMTRESFVGRIKRLAGGALRLTKARLRIQSLRPLL